MSESPVEMAQLLDSASVLLERQREALVASDVRRVERNADAIATVLAAIREHLESGANLEPIPMRRFQHLLRLNRILLENGLRAADHFMLSLCTSPERTSILLSERA